jgi:hypothetical protein
MSNDTDCPGKINSALQAGFQASMSTQPERAAAGFRPADSAQPRELATPLIASGLDCKPRLEMALSAVGRGDLLKFG